MTSGKNIILNIFSPNVLMPEQLRLKIRSAQMIDRQNIKARTGMHTRREVMAGAAIAVGGLAMGSMNSWAAAEEISRNAESIHQEPIFKASPKRIYEALLDPKQFDKVTQMSGAMKGMSLASKPTEISAEAGGAFSLFGGYVTGRHIELVPNMRIVQAWRAGSWGPGDYSITRFELTEQGSATKIIFDHTGFPKGTAEHLASGWRSNYWQPLEQFLAQ
jgi:activator of HSP90 ATPase